MDAALYDRLTTEAGVSALVSTRVSQMRAPQNPTYPLLVFSRTNSDNFEAMTASTNVSRRWFEVVCLSQTDGGLITLMNAVRAALNRWRGTHQSIVVYDCIIRGESSFYDDELNLYVGTIDIEGVYSNS